LAFDVLIVGTGHAGAHAAISLRQQCFGGTIALLGEETGLPYERPPLSKAYLAGRKAPERLLIRTSAFWSERGIALLPGRRVVAVEPDRHVVRAADGERIQYGKLIWAGGGRARKLGCAGSGLAGVCTLRSLADADRMRTGLQEAERVVIIGAGFIGLEVAATLKALGKKVTVVESEARVLSRAVGVPLAKFLEQEHRARGVDLRLGSHVAHMEGIDGHVSRVVLESGERLPADMVVVGVGLIPEADALLDAGAAGGDGVDVDERCQTSLPDIHAVGDCASQVSPFRHGARARIESVQNAVEQASTAASAVLGKATGRHAVPWFWSEQYDLRVQMAGLSRDYDDCIVRGAPTSGSFSVLYVRDQRLIAADCVNAPRDFAQARALILNGARVRGGGALSDSTIPLTALG